MENNLRINDQRVQEEDEIDLLDLAKYLLNYWLPILLCMVIGLGVAGVYTKLLVKPKYTSSSLVYIRGSSSAISSLSDLQIGTYLSQDYEVVYSSRPVLENVINKLGLDMDYIELGKIVTVTNESNTRVLEISCTTTDPNVAKDIVNSIVEYGTDMVKEMDSKEPYIIERAVANPKKVSPSMSKNMAIGGLLGLVASCGILVVMYLLNDKINGSEMVETKLGIPVIGTIAESESLVYDKTPSKKKKKKESHHDEKKEEKK